LGCNAELRGTELNGDYCEECWPDDDDEAPSLTVYDEQSRLHVLRAQCSSCIFLPGNRMSLRSGRVREMVAECDARDTNVICHQTLVDGVQGAFCRGSVDRRAGQAVRIFGRLPGGIIEDDPPAENSLSSSTK
jgi:hypothetical protein